MSTTRWAARIVGGIADDVRRDLADSLALALAIELHFGLTVTAAEAFDIRGAGGWCDGVSVIDSGLILYRPTPSRRENFTLMHELGHHLVAQDIDCLSWLADQPEPARALEQLCDQIAADLLVHPADVAAVLAGGPPDAAAAVALFDATEASRSACAIALTRKLPCDGFVVLIEEGADEVFFAARARDTRPYAWRGDSLPAGHPLRQTPPPARALAWWPDPTGRDAGSTSCPARLRAGGTLPSSPRTTCSVSPASTSPRPSRRIVATTGRSPAPAATAARPGGGRVHAAASRSAHVAATASAVAKTVRGSHARCASTRFSRTC